MFPDEQQQLVPVDADVTLQSDAAAIAIVAESPSHRSRKQLKPAGFSSADGELSVTPFEESTSGASSRSNSFKRRGKRGSSRSSSFRRKRSTSSGSLRRGGSGSRSKRGAAGNEESENDDTTTEGQRKDTRKPYVWKPRPWPPSADETVARVCELVLRLGDLVSSLPRHEGSVAPPSPTAVRNEDSLVETEVVELEQAFATHAIEALLVRLGCRATYSRRGAVAVGAQQRCATLAREFPVRSLGTLARRIILELSVTPMAPEVRKPVTFFQRYDPERGALVDEDSIFTLEVWRQVCERSGAITAALSTTTSSRGGGGLARGDQRSLQLDVGQIENSSVLDEPQHSPNVSVDTLTLPVLRLLCHKLRSCSLERVCIALKGIAEASRDPQLIAAFRPYSPARSPSRADATSAFSPSVQSPLQHRNMRQDRVPLTQLVPGGATCAPSAVAVLATGGQSRYCGHMKPVVRLGDAAQSNEGGASPRATLEDWFLLPSGDGAEGAVLQQRRRSLRDIIAVRTRGGVVCAPETFDIAAVRRAVTPAVAGSTDLAGLSPLDGRPVTSLERSRQAVVYLPACRKVGPSPLARTRLPLGSGDRFAEKPSHTLFSNVAVDNLAAFGIEHDPRNVSMHEDTADVVRDLPLRPESCVRARLPKPSVAELRQERAWTKGWWKVAQEMQNSRGKSREGSDRDDCETDSMASQEEHDHRIAFEASAPVTVRQTLGANTPVALSESRQRASPAASRPRPGEAPVRRTVRMAALCALQNSIGRRADEVIDAYWDRLQTLRFKISVLRGTDMPDDERALWKRMWSDCFDAIAAAQREMENAHGVSLAALLRGGSATVKQSKRSIADRQNDHAPKTADQSASEGDTDDAEQQTKMIEAHEAKLADFRTRTLASVAKAQRAVLLHPSLSKAPILGRRKGEESDRPRQQRSAPLRLRGVELRARRSSSAGRRSLQGSEVLRPTASTASSHPKNRAGGALDPDVIRAARQRGDKKDSHVWFSANGRTGPCASVGVGNQFIAPRRRLYSLIRRSAAATVVPIESTHLTL